MMNNNIKKNKYTSPEIECITLDNEISLQLESSAPFGPGEEQAALKIGHENISFDSMKSNYI